MVGARTGWSKGAFLLLDLVSGCRGSLEALSQNSLISFQGGKTSKFIPQEPGELEQGLEPL